MAPVLAGLALVALAGCGQTLDAPGTSGGGAVAISVAPLTLPGIADACYTFTVTNGKGQTVWTRANVCASDYGDGAGSVSYVGTCDAASDAAENTVSVTLDGIYASGGAEIPRDSYDNPTASGAVSQTVTCVANQDVAVSFDLTVMRMATQGFFDVAVSFADIFCSAKFDCKTPGGDAIALLSQPGGGRGPTGVLAFACTGGEGSDTVLHMSDLVLTCPSRPDLVIDPTAGPGNLSAASASYPNTTLFEAATYRGVEQLGSYNKRYWNVALGLSDVAGCTLAATATASDVAFVDGWTPAGTTYPYVSWAVDFDTCDRHELNGGDGVVSTAYTGLDGALIGNDFSSAGTLSWGAWWSGQWSYQQALSITAGATPLTADSTFTFTLDHATLVAAGEALAGGDDVRLLHWSGSAWDELDRVALDAWNTGAVTLAFSPAVAIAANATDSDYALAYGNPSAGAPPADGRNVYWLWEDFDDGDFTTGNVWSANFGSWSVVNGYARLTNPTSSDNFEAGLYYPGGAAWTDYVMTVRMRDASTGAASYPGPALRVKDPAINNTTLWWFEYDRNTTQATMRPFVNNSDYSWVYNVTLPSSFPSNTWVTGEYQVVADRIWSWLDGNLLHNGTQVSSTHLVNSGSVALGAHSNYGAPQEFHYDDVHVWRYLPDPPVISLGAVTAH